MPINSIDYFPSLKSLHGEGGSPRKNTMELLLSIIKNCLWKKKPVDETEKSLIILGCFTPKLEESHLYFKSNKLSNIYVLYIFYRSLAYRCWWIRVIWGLKRIKLTYEKRLSKTTTKNFHPYRLFFLRPRPPMISSSQAR